MKTESQTAAGFPQTVAIALAQLKQRLQSEYEQAYPDLREIIHLVLDEEEAAAWKLSLFPHLILPDLVETHIARLNLRPVHSAAEPVVVPHDFTPNMPQLAFA